MELRVLGPVEVLTDGDLVALGGPKPRLLLAALLADRRRMVPLDRLVHVLWGDDAPSTAVPTLQTHVSRLRRVLAAGATDARVTTTPPGYRLEVAAGVVDADRFEAEFDRARERLADDPAGSWRRVDRALAEWRGPAFAEFADLDGIAVEATRLEELRVAARELAADARLACGAHRELVGELEALVAEHPLRERSWGLLMLALHRSGRPAEALRRSRELRTLLREELGLTPGASIQELETAILTGSPTLDRPATPARSSSVLPSVRRRGPNVFVGRTADLELLRSLLAAGERLVTVVGPGGVGKTRVVQELLPVRAETAGPGVRWTEFAPVAGPDEATAALATALDVQRRPERTLEESIVEALRPQELVLVLDNCEHVLEAVVPVVARVLRWCPRVLVLATSREALGLAGEVTVALAPLQVPPPRATPAEVHRSDAGSLFVARAAAARGDVVPDERSASAIAEICRRLDGLPLALELAAARVRSMTVTEVAERLDERFRLLESRRAPDPRHRSLLEVVEWSYGLLDVPERDLFDTLSVFAGSFTLRRAEDVCAGVGTDRTEVGRLLAALVEKSMVVAREVDGETRFHLLETLRAFGRARLAGRPDAEDTRTAHARAHLDAARAAAGEMGGADEGSWARSTDREMEDLREAVTGSLAVGDLDVALELVASVREFAFRAVRYEVFRWAEAVVDEPGAATRPLFPLVLGVVSYGRFVRGELTGALVAGRRALAGARRLGSSTGGLPERALGNALFYRGETVAALAAMDGMVEAALRSRDDSLIAHAYYMRSVAQTSVGDPRRARGLADLAQAAARRCAAPTALAQAAYATGLCREHDEPDTALRLLGESAVLAESVGNRWLRAFARTEELSLRASRGDLAAAVRGFPEVLETWFRGGDWANMWLSLRHLSTIFIDLGDDRTSAMLLGAIDAAGATTALPFQPDGADRAASTVVALRERLGSRDFADAWARGRTMRDEEVLRTALHSLGAVSPPGRGIEAADRPGTHLGVDGRGRTGEGGRPWRT